MIFADDVGDLDNAGKVTEKEGERSFVAMSMVQHGCCHGLCYLRLMRSKATTITRRAAAPPATNTSVSGMPPDST